MDRDGSRNGKVCVEGVAWLVRNEFKLKWETAHGNHFLGDISHKLVWSGELSFVDFPENKTTRMEVVISFSDECYRDGLGIRTKKATENSDNLKELKRDTQFWGKYLGGVANFGDSGKEIEEHSDFFDEIKGDCVFLCVSFGRIGMASMQHMGELSAHKKTGFHIIAVIPFFYDCYWTAAFLVAEAPANNKMLPKLAIPRNKKLASKFLDKITTMSGTLVCGENAQEPLKQGVNFLGRVQTSWPLHAKEEPAEISIILKSAPLLRSSPSLVASRHSQGNTSPMYCTSCLVEGHLVRSLVAQPWNLLNVVDVDFSDEEGKKEEDIFDREMFEGVEINLVLINAESRREIIRPNSNQYILLLRRDVKGKWSGYFPSPSEMQNLIKALVAQRRSAVFNRLVFDNDKGTTVADEQEGMSTGLMREDIVYAEVPEDLRQGSATISKPFRASGDSKKNAPGPKKVPESAAESGKKGKKKKNQQPKVKAEVTEAKAATPARAPAPDPLKLGDDKDWAKMRKILDAVKVKCDEMSECGDREEVMDKCAFCFKEEFDMPRCARCGVFSYCSKTCARKNARNHDKECREARNESVWNTILKKARACTAPVMLGTESSAAATASYRGRAKGTKRRHQNL